MAQGQTPLLPGKPATVGRAAFRAQGRVPDQQEWKDLIARTNHSAIYAVTTTGIACRFGCPAPRPLRQNTRLFDSLAEATAAGFRPCLRCKP